MNSAAELADTIPAPADVNANELADELERFALVNIDKHCRNSDFFSGWVTGVRASAEYCRNRGTK